MTVILFLIISSVSVGSAKVHTDAFQHHYETLESCVLASDRLKKILLARDNMQLKDTEIKAYCEVSRGSLSEQEYLQAENKLRRLENLYGTSRW